MPTRVDVVGQGTIEFPDSMSDDQIQEVLRRDFSSSPTPATDVAAEQTPTPPPETLGQRLSRWAQAPSPEWMRPAEAAIREPLQEANRLAAAPSPEWMQPAERFIREPLPGAKEAARVALEQSPLFGLLGAAQVIAPESKIAQVGRAVEETTAENLAGFMSPGNLALAGLTAGAGELLPASAKAMGVVNRLIAAGFAVPQAKQSAQLFDEYTKETDPAKKLRLGIGLAEAGVLTAILGKQAFEGGGLRGLRTPVEPGAPLSEAQTAAATDVVSARQKMIDLLKEPGITRGDPRLAEAEDNLKTAQDAWIASMETAAAQEAPTPEAPVAPEEPLGRPARKITVAETAPVAPGGGFGGEAVPINWGEVQRRVITQAQMERLKPIKGIKGGKGVPEVTPWEQAGQMLEQFQREQAFEDAVREQQILEREQQRATQERQQQISGEPEYQGVPQGPNVPAYPPQVREETGGRAGGGGGIGGGPPEPAPEAPVIDRKEYLRLRRERAAGRPIEPQQHEQMRAYEQAQAQGRLGVAKEQGRLAALTQRVINEISVEQLPKFQARVRELIGKGETEENALEKALKDFTTEGVKTALETGQEREQEAAKEKPEPVAGGLGYPLGEVSGTHPFQKVGPSGAGQTPEQAAANAAVLAAHEAEFGRPQSIAEQMAEDALWRKRAEQEQRPPPSLAERTVAAIREHGGITVDLRGNEPAEGFAFAPAKETEAKFPMASLSEADILGYLDKHRAALEQDGAHIGGWDNGQGQAVLDVSVVHPNELEALVRAKTSGQDAIFDLKSKREIPTDEGLYGYSAEQIAQARQKIAGATEQKARRVVGGVQAPGAPERPVVRPAEIAQPPPLPPPPLPVQAALAQDVGPATYASAAAERAKDPTVSLRVSQSLAQNPRPATAKEFTHLNEHLIDLETEQGRAIADRNANPDDVLARDRADRLNQEIIDQRDLIKRTRSITNKSLNAINELDNQRMELPRMRAEAQALANDGRPLETNPELEKMVEDTYKGIKETEKNIAEAQAHQLFEETLRDERTQARVSEAKLQPRRPLLQNAYEAAIKRIEERRGRLHVGFDPTAILDEAIVGAYHIERGLTKFADWVKAMIAAIGPRPQPYMEELFARSKQYHIEAAKALKQPSRLTPEEAKEMRVLGKTERAIGQLQAGKAPTTARPPPLPVRPRAAVDPFLIKQLAKKEQLIGEYNAAIAKARWQKLPLVYRAGVRVLGVGQEIQTMKSAFDISGVLRQGGILVAGHPVAAGKAFGALAKAAQWGRAGELGAHEVMAEIENNPLNVEDNVLKRGKVELTNPFASEHEALANTAKEEAFKGVLAKKIPGVNWSDRTFHVFLNKLRAESYYGLVNQLEKWTGRKATDAELQVLGNYVNIATGRGSTGGWIKSYEGLSKIMWSPRLFMSRLQYLGLQPLWRGAFKDAGAAPVARAMIAAEYAKSVSGLALALSLATMTGATIELDRRSKDFGKVRFGNTRFDLMAGLQQPFVLGSQLIAGSQKTSKGKVVPIRGKVPYGQPTARELVSRFAFSKATPAIGVGLNLASGQTITGQPTTPINEALTAFLPLSPADVSDALQADGVSRQGAGVMLALMGVGVGTYRPVTQREKDAYRATMERRDRALLHGDIPEAARLTVKLQQGPY